MRVTYLLIAGVALATPSSRAFAEDCPTTGPKVDCVERFANPDQLTAESNPELVPALQRLLHAGESVVRPIRDAAVIHGPGDDDVCYGVARSPVAKSEKDYFDKRRTRIYCPQLCGHDDIVIEAFPAFANKSSRAEPMVVFHDGDLKSEAGKEVLVTAPADGLVGDPDDRAKLVFGFKMSVMASVLGLSLATNQHALTGEGAMTDAIALELQRIRGRLPVDGPVLLAPLTYSGSSNVNYNDSFALHPKLEKSGDFTTRAKQLLAKRPAHLRVIFPRFGIGLGSVERKKDELVVTLNSGGGHFELVYVDFDKAGAATITHVNSTGAGDKQASVLKDDYERIDNLLLQWIQVVSPTSPADKVPLRWLAFKQYTNMGCGMVMLRMIRKLVATAPAELTAEILTYGGPNATPTKAASAYEYANNTFFEEYVQRACYAIQNPEPLAKWKAYSGQ